MPWHIPLLIFCARILDVSIGTVRIIVVMRGHRVAAALLGFAESIVWILAVSQVLIHIRESWITLIAYGAGFGAGTLIGMVIEQRVALGEQVIRVVNTDTSLALAEALRAEDWRVTEVQGQGAKGPVEICFLAMPRRHTQATVERILALCPTAFITVQDLRDTSTAFTRLHRSRAPGWLRLIKFK